MLCICEALFTDYKDSKLRGIHEDDSFSRQKIRHCITQWAKVIKALDFKDKLCNIFVKSKVLDIVKIG